MNTILKSINRFATINTQYLLNKSRNAVRFEAQNILWDYEQVNYQSNAFSKGLASLSFKQNDNFLIRVPSNQQAESYIAKLGTVGINANLIVSKARTQAEAEKQIASNNISAIIFEPTYNLNNEQYIDVLNKFIPELTSTQNGARIKSTKFPSLSALIQTNFYSYPGVYKFRSILNYADDKYFKIPSNVDAEPISLPQSQNTLVITNPAGQFAYKAGILNSSINGKYLLVVQPSKVNKIASSFNNKVDVLVTQELFQPDPEIHLIVPKGSGLNKQHKNRTQI